MENNTARIDRLADEPWLAEVTDIVTLATRRGAQLTPSDVDGKSGDYTIDGMEWYAWLDAVAPVDTPQSGYTPCACRDCMDVAISSDVTQPALCLLCKGAGCLPCLAQEADRVCGTSHECQRDDAYGEC